MNDFLVVIWRYGRLGLHRYPRDPVHVELLRRRQGRAETRGPALKRGAAGGGRRGRPGDLGEHEGVQPHGAVQHTLQPDTWTIMVGEIYVE